MGCGASSQPVEPAIDLNLRGVAVKHLRGPFIQAVLQAGHSRDSTVPGTLFAAGAHISVQVYAIEADVIRALGKEAVCPRDGLTGSAYCDAVADAYEVGQANCMLSYARGSSVSDIVDSMVAYCEREGIGDATNVWMCCLCINQWRVQPASQHESTSTFLSEFESRVRGIGRILCLMTPWTNPANMKRLWCIHELWFAVQESGCSFDIVMPPAEHQNFTQMLVADFGAVAASLCRVDWESAEASVPSDKHHLQKLVREGVGVEEVNKAVLEALQGWLLRAGESVLASLPTAETKCLTFGLGQLLHSMGHHQRALPMLEKSLATSEELTGPASLESAQSLEAVADVLEVMGETPRALSLIQRSVDIRKSLLDQQPSLIALCERSLAMCEKQHGPDHPSTGTRLNNLANRLIDIDKYAEALPLLRRSLAISEKQHCFSEHPETASRLHSLAHVLKDLGKLNEALPLLERALAIYHEHLGPKEKRTQNTQNELESLHKVLKARKLSKSQGTQRAYQTSSHRRCQVFYWKLSEINISPNSVNPSFFF